MDSREFQNVGIFSDQSRETPDFLKILALLMTNILYCSSHEFFIFWLFYLLKALQNVDRFQRIQQERWHISNKVLFVLHIWIVTKKKIPQKDCLNFTRNVMHILSECNRYTMHKLTQWNLTDIWLTISSVPACALRFPSDWSPFYNRVTPPDFDIFKMAGSFQLNYCNNWINIWMAFIGKSV